MLDTNTAKRHALVSAAIIVIGIITVIVTRAIGYPEKGFWSTYVDGFNGLGLMAILLGAVWCGFSCLALFTDFFATDRSLTSDKYAMHMSVITVATIVLIAICVPNVNLFEDGKFSKDPKQRETQQKHHNNLKGILTVGLLAGGVLIASVPTRRFFKKA